MIILTDMMFKDALAPFIKWKTQKGFKVTVLYKGSGQTYLDMKNAIENEYKSSAQPPDYLLIIGDTEKIPYYGSGSVTDLYYGEFSGNGDYIPEMFIGRLPVSNVAQLVNVTSKIMQYEKYQLAPASDFYSRALVTAGDDQYHARSINGHVYYAANNYLNSSNKLTGIKFTYEDVSQSSKTVEDSIRKLTRSGLAFMNYTGHAEVTGWAAPNLKSGDLDTVSTIGKYPFIISNACQTSVFNSASAFGNRMLLGYDEKKKVFKGGAIGFIGGSADTYWDEDFYWVVGTGSISATPTYSGKGLGAYDRLFHTHGESPSEWYCTMGQITFAGNMSVSASTSGLKKYYWEIYNLVGDPSVIPIIGKPTPFTTQLPDILPKGIRTVTLSAEPFSYVAISDGETLWDASHASPSGSVELSLPASQGNTCLIVMTGQNKIPVMKEVALGTIEEEYLNFAGYAINDKNGGNDNKLADFGEMVSLTVKAENRGGTQANNVRAKISTASDLITITGDEVFIGTLDAEAETELTDGLSFTVNENVTDQSITTINLTLESEKETKHYVIDVVIHAPELQIVSCTIDDSETGNGNRIADPGETFRLVYKIRNSGSSNASGNFSVTASDAGMVTVVDASQTSGILKHGETTEIPVTVQVAPSAAFGSYFGIASTVSCGAYVVKNDFTFRVGMIREGFETESFNLFPWVNASRNPWTVTSGNFYDGNFSALSGAIGNNASTSLCIGTVYEAGDEIKFMYNVSSEEKYDFLIFKINGREMLKESGESGWKEFSAKVTAGFNRFEWIYVKDNSTAGGKDCAWVDMIDFAQTGSLRYIRKDLQVARVVPPPERNRYSMEPVQVKLTNVGTDTIDSFTLAYRVNSQAIPVQETFIRKIIPFGDTATVEFSEKFDFSRFDRYDITVYAVENSDDYNRNDTASYMFVNELTDSLTIYPNPFIDRFTVYINSSYYDRATISIINMSGKTVYETQTGIVTGKNPVVINAPQLPPSIYTVIIRTSRETKSLRAVKTMK
jgi:hypothetical protein